MENYFAENLKRLRKEKNYTQQELAEKTNLQRNTIALYESGKRQCDFDTLLFFAEVLNCSTDDLLKKEKETNLTKGFIYILTNPSFPNFVKIGYANDVKRRLKEFNRSVCVPYSFRIYATYAVNTSLTDKNLHSIIDKLNPDLRAIEREEGRKTREREFYAMKAEDAYSILEAIAEMHGYTGRLERAQPNEIEIKEAKEAKDIEREHRARSNNFTFSEWKIPKGAVLNYKNDETITCEVLDERMVDFRGKRMSLTGVAKKLLGKETGVCGPKYFTYKSAKLWDIENRKQD